MHRNEVVDLQKFRDADTGSTESDEAGSQYLPAGTTLLVGQYIIDGYLNCGGFGITYTARDSLGRKVVIKECFPSEMVYRKGRSMASRSPKYKDELSAIVRNFVVEAHSLANVKHDNIVHVHQIFEENRTAYIAMDYVDAPDLLDLMDSKRRLSPKDVQVLTCKMLDAIGYIHRMGMLHRDISPDNILLQDTGAPVLIDFGAARQLAKSGPQAAARMKFVKDGYSPQEFYVAGSEQGTFSDLYAFAASIYHVITSAAPIDAQTRLAALAAKKPDPYAPLAGGVQGYPAGFLEAIDKALAVLPQDRMQTAEDWLGAIEVNAAEGAAALFKPVTAVLESLSIFDEKSDADPDKARRRKTPLLAAGVAGFALLIGGALFWTQGVSDQSPSVALANTPVEPNPPELARIAELSAPQVMISVWPEGFSSGLENMLAEEPVGLGSTRAPQALPQVAGLPLPAPQVGIVETAALDGVFKAPAAPLRGLPLEMHAQSEAAFAAVTHGIHSLFAVPVPKPPQKITRPASDLANRNQTTVPSTDVAVTSVAPVALAGQVETLPQAARPQRVTIDTSAPVYTPTAATQAVQDSFSRWALDLPFGTTPRMAEGVETLVVTDIGGIENVSGSNDWIAEGVAIVAIDGQPLEPRKTLEEHILSALKIGEDGMTRTPAWVRRPGEDVLDQTEIVVPVFRQTGLADGTLLETRKQGESWVTRVASLGSAATELRIGDLILGNTAASGRFSNPQAVETALTTLAQSGATAAEFSILRNGQRLTASWRIAAGQ